MIREFRGIIFPSISRYDLKYLGSSLDTSSRQSQIEKFSKALFKKRALRLKDLASLKTQTVKKNIELVVQVWKFPRSSRKTIVAIRSLQVCLA